MFPDSFPFYKLECDLQAHINPCIFYILVNGTIVKILSEYNFDLYYLC